MRGELYRMKKYILGGVIFVIVIICIFLMYRINKQYNKNYEEYCYRIYKEILDIDFTYAKLEEKAIIFYDDDFNELEKMEYENMNSKYKIVYIENSEETMRFWKSGFLDDGIGVLFIKDEELSNALSGIKIIKRSNGNSYWFTTS